MCKVVSAAAFAGSVQGVSEVAEGVRGGGIRRSFAQVGLSTCFDEVLALILTRSRRYERRSSEGRPNIAELQTSCLVLNTAEYCLETATQVSS